MLYAKGLDSNTISELTGINPNDQNNWIVAGTVYDSIAASGKVNALHGLELGLAAVDITQTDVCGALMIQVAVG